MPSGKEWVENNYCSVELDTPMLGIDTVDPIVAVEDVISTSNLATTNEMEWTLGHRRGAGQASVLQPIIASVLEVAQID